MASNISTIPPDAILNPYTPLVFLPPNIAYQLQVICYIHVATLAAFTWDWLMAIPEEYRIIRQVGLSRPNVAYFLSRFGTFGTCLSTTIFKIALIDDCKAIKYVEGAFLEIGVTATSLLFFFRVKAVYNNSRIITAFFGLLWLAITGLNILILSGMSKHHIPHTRRCFESTAPKYSTAPFILAALNDTLVFLAISYHILSSAMVSSTWSARVKSFVTGNGLLHLSKALLQSGQVYYFVTIGMAIATTAFILSPGVPGVLKPVLGSVYIALSSAMACRVYRVILGVLTDFQDSHPTTNTILSSIVQPTILSATKAYSTISNRR
ncbi:hypothetical protein PILCRDRAFT_12289 [Piloderma croceum F 1598]|uniref:DUF6533 domain-containing protein n=1 Tax=Piloderma croceum (strain F 1598) TaxID=765440 RepID=A0A0C3FB97_PILCF|nr:hypothetical protein PILCRDRAFT_12289 [Piloderma croceum F 1598]